MEPNAAVFPSPGMVEASEVELLAAAVLLFTTGINMVEITSGALLKVAVAVGVAVLLFQIKLLVTVGLVNGLHQVMEVVV